MEIKTFQTTAKRNRWQVILFLILGIMWFVIGHEYFNLITGITLILCALWTALSIVKSRLSAVTIDPNGIQMDGCASLVKNGRVTKPQTLTIGWEQIEKIEKHALTLYSGELYVIWDNYMYYNIINRRYRIFTTPSAINSDAWKEIERYHRIHNDKTQQ